MPDARPLLSICIPTFNRGRFLAELLEGILPQLSALANHGPTLDLLISDNASTDQTPEIVAALQARGLPARYVRNATNLGADANFLQCLSLAEARYVWVLGDDDLVMPGALAALLSLLSQGESGGGFDLVYLSSFGFPGIFTPPPAASLEDRFGRFAEIVTDGVYLLEKVNALIGLISVVIINRDRLLATPHPPLTDLIGTNLLQTGWIFPLLHARCRVLYIWQRLLGYRHFNSGGWGICEVFGVRLERIARRSFAAEPELARALMNGVLRYWLPDSIMLARTGRENAMHVEDVARTLRPLFRRNWRFWIFVYPVVALPLPLARAAHALLSGLNRTTRIVQAARRHLFARGTLLRPAAPALSSKPPIPLPGSVTTTP